MASAGTLLLEPVVGWPREMTPGRPYLVTVDLRLAEAAGDWPYDEEELSFTCVLEGPAAFTVEAVHDASVVLHRFGGSYGPAEFVVTPHAEPGIRSLWLTILTERGVDVRRIELPVDVGYDAGDARPTTTRPVRTAVPAQRPAPPESGAVTRLIVDVEPVAHSPGDRYLLRVLKIRPDGAFAGSAVDRSGPLSVDELAVRSGFALAQLADDPHDLWVEFVLPDELLGLPVDQWPLERSGSAPVPVGAVLPVVVRGRSAALNLGQQARWQRRSRALRRREDRSEQDRIFWVPRETPDARSLYGSLLQADYVCAVFEREPYPGLHALRSAGVPAAVWCRTPRFAEEFVARLARVLPGEPVSELPYLVLRLRQEAASVTAPDRHFGSHITLLWDDADHEQPVAEPLAEPEEDDGPAEVAASTPEAQAPVRRLCLLMYITTFHERTDVEQMAARRLLWAVVARACHAAGMERDRYEIEDLGEGLLLVLPPGLNEAEVLPALTTGLRSELRQANHDVGSNDARVRLRAALVAGEMYADSGGDFGPVLLMASRLVDSPQLRSALAYNSKSDLAIIVANSLAPEDFGYWASILEPINVSTKWLSTSAWLLVPDPRGIDLCPTLTLIGAGRAEEFLALVRARVDADAELLYIAREQTAVRISDAEDHHVQIIERILDEVTERWGPDYEMRFETHRFRPYLLDRLVVVDFDGRPYELSRLPATTRVFQIAEEMQKLYSDRHRPHDPAEFGVERIAEGGRPYLLDRSQTLHDAALRDGDELRLVGPEPGGDRWSDDPASLESLLATPGAHLIVDGDNVAWQGVPFEADQRDRLLADRRNRLVSGLGDLAERTGAEITCVFDAAVSAKSLPSPSPRGVRVLFPEKADVVEFMERLARAETGRPVAVVSSDWDAANAVEQAGALPVQADSLWQLLDSEHRSGQVGTVDGTSGRSIADLDIGVDSAHRHTTDVEATSEPRPGQARSGRCAIFACDIASFGDPARNNRIREYLRTALYESLRRGFDATGVPFDGCYHEDRGDGVIIVPPPDTDPVVLVHPLVDRLRDELRRHNDMAEELARIRLRVSTHIGEVAADGRGIVGAAVNHVHRLLDAPRFKEMFNASGATVGLIVSAEVYETVIRHDQRLEPDEYAPIEVQVKETSTTAWVRNLPRGSERIRREPEPAGAGIAPSASPRRELRDVQTLFPVVSGLLALPIMATSEGRDQVVRALPGEVAARIPRQNAANLDTHAILRTCLNSPGGLRELLTILRAFTGDSAPMRELEATIETLTARPPEDRR